MKGINFNPGPSQLYFTVADHMRAAFREGVPSLSHRTKEFEAISGNATEGLRNLLSIPVDFQILFTGSATEVWERSIQNLVEKKSLHFVNGAFSRKYFEIATQLGKQPEKIEVPIGQAFTGTIPHFEEAELIALTHNETSTGVSLPLEFIHQFKSQYPEALMIVDAVSSLPYPSFDFTKIDSLFFSVQKGFGLPAGLGVWIVNDRCIEKAHHILSKGMSIGSYHNLPSLIQHGKRNQTPETPNVLAIYLLSKVVEDFLRRGIHVLRKETEYKAALLYHELQKHPLAAPFVTNPAFQSKSVIVAHTGAHTTEVAAFLASKGLYAGDGYGEQKHSQLRFANFPAHSKEQFELLVDLLQKLR